MGPTKLTGGCHCGVMVAVFYRNGARLIGTVNAKAVEGGKGFGPEQPTSPKMLSANEKPQRWQSIWFPLVTIEPRAL
jgi:hypothetical protein